MLPPSTTLKPAGTPSLAECASRFQCAVPRTCQMPFRSGLRSGVRGPLYEEEAVWRTGEGGAPRCAWATTAAVAIASAPRLAPVLSERTSRRIERPALSEPTIRRVEGFIPDSRESTLEFAFNHEDHDAP